MKLIGSGLHINNLEESIKFYEEVLGFKLDMKFDAGDLNLAFLTKDSFRLELLEGKDKRVTSHTEDTIFRFAVESLDETMKFLESKGVKVHSGPFSPQPNIRFIFIKDPSGVLIQLAEDVK